MITQAMCNSFKEDVLQGIHQPGDTYMIALYDELAVLSKMTTAYTASHEVPDSGDYTAGGQALIGFTTGTDLDTAFIDWTTDPIWHGATITARGALIYNASRSNKAVAVFNFGRNVVSENGTFTISLPAPAASTAAVRIK